MKTILDFCEPYLYIKGNWIRHIKFVKKSVKDRIRGKLKISLLSGYLILNISTISMANIPNIQIIAYLDITILFLPIPSPIKYWSMFDFKSTSKKVLVRAIGIRVKSPIIIKILPFLPIFL